MTSLSQQLATLRLRPGYDDKLAKSFLFLNADAKQLSREQIHDLALDGLRILLSIDNRFIDFINTLFSRDGVRKERIKMNSTESEFISKETRKLFVLLSPHLFLTAAQQVVEYMVRIYEVHTFDVSTVLAAFLPYHDHAIFGRLLMLLDLRGSGFNFLEKNQLQGSVLPRQTLVTAVSENNKLLRLIGDFTQDSAKAGVNNATFTLFAGVACALHSRPNNEAAFRILLPYLVRMIEEASPRATPTAFLIICVWSNNTRFSIRILSILLRVIIDSLPISNYPVSVSNVLATLGVIFRTQSTVIYDIAFNSSINLLIELPWEDFWVKNLIPKGTSHLLHRLLDYSLVNFARFGPILTEKNVNVKFVSAACNYMNDLSQKEVIILMKNIIGYNVIQGESHIKSTCISILKVLERRFTKLFDASLGSIIGELNRTGDGYEALSVFLSSNFSGSKYDTLEVKNNNKTVKLSILSCIMHPVPEVRITAFKALQGETEVANTKTVSEIFEKGSLLSLIQSSIALERNVDVSMQALEFVHKLISQASCYHNSDTIVFKLVTSIWVMLVSSFSIDLLNPMAEEKSKNIIEIFCSMCTDISQSKSLLIAATGSYYILVLGTMKRQDNISDFFQQSVNKIFPSSSDDSVTLKTNNKMDSDDEKDITEQDNNCFLNFSRTSVFKNTSEFLLYAVQNDDYINDLVERFRVSHGMSNNTYNNKSEKNLGVSSSVELSLILNLLTMLACSSEGRLHHQNECMSVLFNILKKVGSYTNGNDIEFIKESLLIGLRLTSKSQSGDYKENKDALKNIALLLSTIVIVLDTSLPSLSESITGSLWELTAQSNTAMGSTIEIPKPVLQLIPLYLHSKNKEERRGGLNGEDEAMQVSISLFKSIQMAYFDVKGDEMTSLEERPITIAFVLFLPLFAPTPQLRYSCVQRIQQAVLQSRSTGSSSVMMKRSSNSGVKSGKTYLLSAVECLMRGTASHELPALSMTAMNSLVEVMAMDSRSEMTCALTEDAADVLLKLVCFSHYHVGKGKHTEPSPSLSSLQLPLRVVASCLRELFGCNRRSIQSHGSRVLESFSSIIKELLVRDNIFFEEAALLSTLSVMSTFQSKTTRVALEAATAMLAKGSVHVCLGNDFYVKPIYGSVLSNLSKMTMVTRVNIDIKETALDSQYLLESILLPLYERGAGGKSSNSFGAGTFDQLSVNQHIVSFLTSKYGYEAILEGVAFSALQDVLTSISVDQKCGDVVAISAGGKRNRSEKKGKELSASSLGNQVSAADSTINIGVLAEVLADAFTAFTTSTVQLYGAAHPLKAGTVCRMFHVVYGILQRRTSYLEHVTGEHEDHVFAKKRTVVALLHLLRVLISTSPSCVEFVSVDASGDIEDIDSLESDKNAMTALRYIVKTYDFCTFTPYCLYSINSDVAQGSITSRSIVSYTTGGGTTINAGAGAAISLATVDCIRYLIDTVANNEMTLGDDLNVVHNTLVRRSLQLIVSFFAVERERMDLRSTIFVIATLLHVIAPILRRPSDKSDTVVGTSNVDGTLLHLPLLVLYLKLESNTHLLRSSGLFETPSEICLHILGFFSVSEQILIISGLMDLVCDPEHYINSLRTFNNEDETIYTLCKTFIKPGKISNRQESLLNFINLVIKSESFLIPFVTLQATQETSAIKKSSSSSYDDSNNALSDDGGCAKLLVSTLGLFGHYHDLNMNTQGPSIIGINVDDEGLTTIPENKAYTMLLELLAGNALGCILAIINERIFVTCQQRLLRDKRATIRRMGLSTILDRLHQSRPTTEIDPTEDDLERTKDLSDPKKRLRSADLYYLHIRPVCGMISVSLLSRLCGLAIKEEHAILISKKTTSSDDSHKQDCQYSFSCIEELVRIATAIYVAQQSQRTHKRDEAASNADEEDETATGGKGSSLVNEREGFFTVDALNEMFASDLKGLLEFFSETINFVMGAQKLMAQKVVINDLTTYQPLLSVVASAFIAMSSIMSVLGVQFSWSQGYTFYEAVKAWCNYIMTLFTKGEVLEVASLSLLRRVLLQVTGTCLPIMVKAFLFEPSPTLITFAVFNQNVSDADTLELSTYLLELIKVLYGEVSVIKSIQQAFALTATVDQQQQASSGRKSLVFITPAHHSIRILFIFVEKLLANMSLQEVKRIPVFSSSVSSFSQEATIQKETDSNDFWLSTCNMLATHDSSVLNYDVMTPVFAAYVTFFMKFTERRCIVLLSKLVEWAFSSGPSGNDQQNGGSTHKHSTEVEAEIGYSKLQMVRHIMFFGLYYSLLQRLGSLISFSFPLVAGPIVELLAQYNETPFSVVSQSNRALNDAKGVLGRRKILRSIANVALISVLRCMQLMVDVAKPENDVERGAVVSTQEAFFAKPDIFPNVMPLLVGQLSNVSLLNESAQFPSYFVAAERSVIPSIRGFFASLNSPKLWSTTQKELIKLLRHSNEEVRRATLLTLQLIYRDGGDQLCSLIMAEGLPAFVEMTEDTSRAIVDQAVKLCNELSTITGQNILEVMG